MDVRRHYVVLLLAVHREFPESGSSLHKQVQRRFPGVAAANFLDPLHTELHVPDIARAARAVREKKNGISGLKLHPSAYRPGSRPATSSTRESRPHGWIKQRVLDGGMAPRNATNKQALIQPGEHTTRVLPGLMNAAIPTYCQALSGDVADRQPDRRLLLRRAGIRAKWRGHQRAADAHSASGFESREPVRVPARSFSMERSSGGSVAVSMDCPEGIVAPREEGVAENIAARAAGREKLAANVTNWGSLPPKPLFAAGPKGKNEVMRPLAYLVVALGAVYFLYQYSLKRMPVSDSGTAPTQAIALTGVRADLLQIAQAERANIAQNGQCASMPEMLSSGAMSMNKPGRDGYTYEINCSGAADFQVVARHAPAPAGSSIRYPTLAIDSLMEVREIQ